MRGNALSHWLTPEAYALRLNAVHSRHLGSSSSLKARIRELIGAADADAFWLSYQTNFVTEADIADMAAEGFNTIRIPFNYRLLSPENQPGVYSEEGFQVLDRVIEWCRNNDLGVILDMHACPGGQSHDAPSDPEHTYWAWDEGLQNWLEFGVACLWKFDEDYFARTGRTPEFNKQRTVDIWRHIANRYKDEPALIGYELINEPFLPYGIHYPDLRALLVQITAAVREVDTNHIIFVEGNYYAGTFEGLVPPWDSQTVLCFHKYWTTNTYSAIANFVETAATWNMPVCMTESGENSNPWINQFVRLLEGNNVGWCMWGYKKVSSISAAFSAPITADYQYVIDNFRDLPVNTTRFKNGLMQMAQKVRTSQCLFDPGWYGALFDPQFTTTPVPFVITTLPGMIYAVNYDVGNQGVSYSDTRYMNTENWDGPAYNNGWLYRNDGVDIQTTSDAAGFKVSWIDSGEWLKFTVNIPSAGKYDITIRTASPNNTGRLQLYLDANPLTSVVSIPRTGQWDNFRATTMKGVNLPAGTHVLQARFPVGGFDFASLQFVKK